MLLHALQISQPWPDVEPCGLTERADEAASAPGVEEALCHPGQHERRDPARPDDTVARAAGIWQVHPSEGACRQVPAERHPSGVALNLVTMRPACFATPVWVVEDTQALQYQPSQSVQVTLCPYSNPHAQVKGSITYNGHSFDQFVPVRTASYINQYDTHLAELTVRETLDFSARCQGPGSRPSAPHACSIKPMFSFHPTWNATHRIFHTSSSQ